MLNKLLDSDQILFFLKLNFSILSIIHKIIFNLITDQLLFMIFWHLIASKYFRIIELINFINLPFININFISNE